MASPKSTYDVIVTGDGLAGLVAAALCARHRLRVLVASGPPAAPVMQDGVSLPRMPLAFAVAASPALGRVATALGIVQTIRRRTRAHSPSFQIALPDARLSVTGDKDRFERELARELPGDKDALLALFRDAGEVSRNLDTVLGQDISLPPAGFWEKRELRYWDTQLPFSDAAPPAAAPTGSVPWAVLSAPGALTLDVDPRALSPIAAARAFVRWREQSARLEGGEAFVRQILTDKLRAHDAGALASRPATGLVTRMRRIHGVTLGDSGELHGARHVIVTQPPDEAARLLERVPRRLEQVRGEVRPTAVRTALHLGIAARGVPVGLGPVCFVVRDPAAEPFGASAFALWTGAPDSRGRVVCTVTANLPLAPDDDDLPGALEKLGDELLVALEEIMPFYRDHLLFVSGPDAIDPLWTSPSPRFLGVSAAPYEAGVKHLVFAGRSTLPGLGLEGELAAGWCAARHVFMTSKRKDYLKDEVLAG